MQNWGWGTLMCLFSYLFGQLTECLVPQTAHLFCEGVWADDLGGLSNLASVMQSAQPGNRSRIGLQPATLRDLGQALDLPHPLVPSFLSQE